MTPIWSDPIYVRRNRSTRRSPATAPIPAPPYCWAARLNDNAAFWHDDNPAFWHDDDSRCGYSDSGRSLTNRRWRSFCGKRRCRVKVGGISCSQNCPPAITAVAVAIMNRMTTPPLMMFLSFS
jgi:hypothetical protein